MKHRISVYIFILLIQIIIPLHTVVAESEIPFRIEPIFPKSQMSDKGYYHFKGDPNQTITLQAKIINESEKELEVLVRSFNAYSGNQGIIYQEEATIEGTSITDEKYQFKNTVNYPEKIKLKPLETKVIEFTMQVPDIQGTLLGSMEFRVFHETEDLSGEDDSSQILIDQYRAMNLGVQVEVYDYSKEIHLAVEQPIFSANQVAIMLPIKNNQPVITPTISGSYQVKDGDEIVINGDIPNFRMAPMTSFHYPLRWTEGKLAPGTYEVMTTIQVGDHEQTFEHKLEIENKSVKEAQELLEERGIIEVESKQFPWMMVMIGIVIFLLLIIIWRLMKPKPKRKDRKYPGQFPNDEF